MNPLVVLSPHFDDAVLSCGGHMWMVRQRGTWVRTISLFAGPPPAPVPPFARVQHAMWGNPPEPNGLRRAEDLAAHARLGCPDVQHLEVPDAVYRLAPDGRPLYGSEEGIFGEVQPEEATFARELVDIVRPHVPEQSTILAPLGAGHHVDHLLGHAVGRILLDEGRPVAFYEDFPYTEREGALAASLADKPGWQVEVLALSDEAMAAKIGAVAYYHSQIPVLFDDYAAMEQRVRAAARAASEGEGYAERIWWPHDLLREG